MRRREFIILLGGNALGCSLKALAQQPAMPVIGYLNAGASAPSGYFVTAFRQGLNETGFVRGTKCGDRVSLGGRSLRAAAGACCRTRQPPGRRSRCNRQSLRGLGCEGGDHIDSHCFLRAAPTRLKWALLVA